MRQNRVWRIYPYWSCNDIMAGLIQYVHMAWTLNSTLITKKLPLIPVNQLIKPISCNCLIKNYIFIHNEQADVWLPANELRSDVYNTSQNTWTIQEILISGTGGKLMWVVSGEWWVIILHMRYSFTTEHSLLTNSNVIFCLT